MITGVYLSKSGCFYDDGPLQSNHQLKAAVLCSVYGLQITAPGISSGLKVTLGTTQAHCGVISRPFEFSVFTALTINRLAL